MISQWARGVRNVVVLSGAGVSTDSGIPDFRGPNGVWTLNPGAQKKYSYQAFLDDPQLRGRFWKSRRENPVWQAEPNAGHRALAELADSVIATTIITQNTDGLHQRAGTPSERVIELHGTMHEVHCVACGHRSPMTDALARYDAGETVPPCLECGGVLKTATIMFSQVMSPEVFERAERAVTGCDLLLAVGTTLNVEPAGSLCATAVRAGASLVIVNRDPTPYDGIAVDVVRDPLGEALPRITAQLLAARDLAAPEPSPVGPSGVRRGPRPSALLRAQSCTARFRSRAAEVNCLVRWCEGHGVRVHLVTGPAGEGKTRLALELADQLGEQRHRLVVVDDAETRQEEVRRIVRGARGPVLLLARTRGEWWDRLEASAKTSEELGPMDGTRSGHADAVRDGLRDYATALTDLGFPCPEPARAVLFRLADEPDLPWALQASILSVLLGDSGLASEQLLARELEYLCHSADRHDLPLSADAVHGAAATAILCGAADERSALAVLGHVSGLADEHTRLRAARWLRRLYPDPAQYWAAAMPDPLAEDLVAAAVTPRFLMGMLMETAEEQDRRALTVLARAAASRPTLAGYLTELLSVLPGLSPAAVDVALHGGHPEPLADALTALARKAALPADLLDAVPPDTTVLGEFPVLLTESLVEAFEQRAERRPETILPALARLLGDLAGRLTDLGRHEEARAAAARASAMSENLTRALGKAPPGSPRMNQRFN